MLRKYPASTARILGNPIFADYLFCGLPPKARASLAGIKQRKRFQKGTTIIAGGEMPAGIYILRVGKARMFLKPELDKGLISRPIKTNEYLGLTEAIAQLPYKMNVISVSSCFCEFIEREDFLRFLSEEPQICFRLAEFLSVRINKNYQLLCFSTH